MLANMFKIPGPQACARVRVIQKPLGIKVVIKSKVITVRNTYAWCYPSSSCRYDERGQALDYFGRWRLGE